MRQVEAGVPVAELCREMGVVEMRRVKQFEDENRRLKSLVADLTLDKHMLQEVLPQRP